MAKYTITIKTLIDNNFDFKMTDYPIFDENYRNILNNKILYHYYENEIGFETAPLFRFYLNQKLNEILPYYNELYKVQKKLIDNLENEKIFNNVDILETFNSTSTGHSTSNSTNSGNSKNKNVYQDTPQGEIKNADVETYNYATNITLDKNETSNTINDNTNTNGTNDYIKSITGNNGGKYKIDILNDVKNNLMNIDLMIINELNDLFMQIF